MAQNGSVFACRFERNKSTSINPNKKSLTNINICQGFEFKVYLLHRKKHFAKKKSDFMRKRVYSFSMVFCVFFGKGMIFLKNKVLLDLLWK